jgi:hypothetical protein
MKKFYGLTGTRLNIAIAIIAGIDFALFGYDQVSLGWYDPFLDAANMLRVYWVAS